MTEPERVLPWREVAPLESINGAIESLLATVDTLRSAWQQWIETATSEEFREARRRSLRRHAIETGIIERIYDVDWGVTEALVAEGLTLEAAESRGSINPETLAIIRSQFDALEYLVDVARGHRPLTVQLVRELHALITKHQETYTATDLLGNTTQAELRHGEWKRWPNHVRRADGSLLEYAPPEQVQQQMERLVDLRGAMTDGHPLVRAAWLHHRFICIHPFEDGNGRVARALVLLELLKHDYAPLVVDRRLRDEYIAALDAANDGDLGLLVRLFARLEIVALRSELRAPVEAAATGGAVSVARAYVERIRDLRQVKDEDRRRLAEQLAGNLQQRVRHHLETRGRELAKEFRRIDPRARRHVYAGTPPDKKSTWWKAQLIRAAREVDFWANVSEGTWWVQLNLSVLDQTFRYVAAIQKVGARDVGVLAMTVFAEIPPPQEKDGAGAGPAHPMPLIRLSSTDSVTMLAGQSVEGVWPEAEELIERTLAAAVARFAQHLS